MQYYKSLYDDIENRKARIVISEKEKTKYYRRVIGLDTSISYTSRVPGYFRFVISRWRLSNHKLKIETLRYNGNNIKIPRDMRKCNLCHVLDDEYHAIFECHKYSLIRIKFMELLRRRNNVKSLLNPSEADIKPVALLLHGIEKLIV